MHAIVALAAAFAVGSIPFGYLLVRGLGKGDVRDFGSGNIGATNVGRVLGPRGWTATLVLDAGKGVAGVLVGGWLASGAAAGLAAGAAGAVLGHCFTPWLAGRGGKGVATMLGAFGLLTPMPTLIAVGGFALTVLLTRWISLGSLVAAALLVASAAALGEPRPTLYAAAAVALVVLVRHRDNIRRLLVGAESRVGGKRA